LTYLAWRDHALWLLFCLGLEEQPELLTFARDDRTPERRVFQGVTADRLRTVIARACTAAGVPSFSPHHLRHRRISLLHLSGVPWARIGEHVGQRNLAVTANTYTHVLVDENEID
jgi:integrase